MLITRIGNEDITVEITNSSYCSIPKYTIALGEADDLSAVPEIKYEDIDKTVAIMLEAKKMIEDEMELDAKNKAEAEKAKELANKTID